MNNQEYELDLVDLGKTILKRWKLLALVTAVVAAVVMAMVVGSNGPASYESSALLSFHLTKRAISISNASEDGKQLDSDLRINMDDASTSLSQRINAVNKLSPIVSSILTGDEALQAAMTGHEPEMTLAELRNGTLVEAVANTDLIKIRVQAKSPELARDVCGALSAYAAENLPSAVDADSIEIVSAAQLPGSPVSKGMARKAVVAVLVGLILSIVYVVLDYILMPKVHTEWMVKNQLGLKLLGTVPAGKEKKTNG